MIKRRTFLRLLGTGLAAGAVGWTLGAGAAWSQGLQDEGIRLACLSDAHLGQGPAGRLAAGHLEAAVAEINALEPPVDLVFFLGDLTQAGDPWAWQLGQEILAGLRAPCFTLPGEHDPAPQARGEGGPQRGVFSFGWRGIHCLGLDSRLSPRAGTFGLTPPLLTWLAQELAHLSPDTPLLLLTHAPLYPLYIPWGWQTVGVEPLWDLLRPRPQVLLLHGHVHQTSRLEWESWHHLGVPATAWAYPAVQMGTTAVRPSPLAEASRSGCGWLLLALSKNGGWRGQAKVWPPAG